MNKKLVTFFSLVIVLISCQAYTFKVEAQQTIVYVDPERTTGLNVGETFQVEIKVGNVTGLRGWEVRIFYKSSVLNASAITPPGIHACPFFNEKAPGVYQVYGIHSYTDNFNATHGQIIAYAALNQTSVSGSGTLLWVNFTAVGYGDSPIDIGPVWELGTILFDLQNDPIQDSTVDGVVHVGLRDVAVTNIEAPKTVPTNSIVKINVTAENQGEVTETFDVTLYYDSKPIETKSLIDMPAGGIKILTFTWDVSGLPIGEYTITAEATQVQGEVDLDDNTYTFDLYVGIRDIAITNTVPSKTVTNDTTVYINVTIENHGEFEETFNVTVYYGGVTIGTQTVANLAIGSAETLTFTWSTFVVPAGSYLITSTATTVPGETNVEDNTYGLDPPVIVIETIKGDVDGNFEVDIRDLYQLAKAYGTTPGHPNWNANCDLNDDGKISIKDLFHAARNFGKEI